MKKQNSPHETDQVYGVILAGGSGTRFWPKSRRDIPKQLCAIGNSEEPMIALTLSRLEGWIPPERRIIITHKDQAALTRKLVGHQCALIVEEPESKNTAAALALASRTLRKDLQASSSSVMISLHADHMVDDVSLFQKTLKKAVQGAKDQKTLILLGAKANYPETGYGYIQVGNSLGGDIFQVKSFREKPPREVAESYVKEGYLWNTGIFIWSLEVWEQELRTFLPKTAELLESSSWKMLYPHLESLAVDHGILEKSSLVSVVPSHFGWQDVGSWDALDRIFPVDAQGNLVYGDGHLIDCQGMVVDVQEGFIGCLGVKDLVVVSSGGAILVCPKDRAQEVKAFVAYLKEKKKENLY